MALQTCGLNLNRVGKELQPHGTLEFPCAGYSARYTGNAEDVIPWHWHESFELLCPKTGRLKLEIPGKTVHLETGDCFFINSNILHFAAAEPQCELHSLVFSPLLVMGSEHSIFADKYILPLIGCTALDGCLLDSECGKTAFAEAFDALLYDQAGCEFTVRETLSRVCLSLFHRYRQQIETGYAALEQNSLRMRQMLDYIHTHFAENLELAQIARAADIGERECLRCFQRVIQVSPMQYLLKYRVMQSASMLMRNADSSIADIAIQCGFDSPSNFAQMFKRFFKCTPREYRKKTGAAELGRGDTSPPFLD